MIFLYLISGLFLGWALGANDAANIFGTAVGSRMVSFRKAALVGGIFVVLGAVIQGSGTTETLGKLGSVNALGGAFTVALCAGITVYIMTRYNLPVSTTQAIVGAIIGWNIFTGNPTDYKILGQIVGTWISGPILGAIFSALLYILMRKMLLRLKIHMVILDSYIRWGLVIVGAFGAYSLGANNIANVMGVFVASAPNLTANFGLFSLDGVQLLFLLGGIAIALGIITYSKRVIQTVGDGILSLSPEAAIVVVLAQALVLFVFSSKGLSNFLESIYLPAIPLVPVSSSQVVVGSIIGIGLVKGLREIRFKILGGIALGWIFTPLIAGVFAFISLFFVKNVFDLTVSSGARTIISNNDLLQPAMVLNLSYPTIFVLFLILLVIIAIVIYEMQRKRLETEKELFREKKEYYRTKQHLTEANLKTMRLENSTLAGNLEFKQKELMFYAMNIAEQREYLSRIYNELQLAISLSSADEITKKLQSILTDVKQKMSFTDEVEAFYMKIEEIHKNFTEKLTRRFPDLTENDYRLLKLLRLGFSSKEIAPLLNISVKSVEMNRYRLRKKLNLDKSVDLVQFINQI